MLPHNLSQTLKLFLLVFTSCEYSILGIRGFCGNWAVLIPLTNRNFTQRTGQEMGRTTTSDVGRGPRAHPVSATPAEPPCFLALTKWLNNLYKPNNLPPRDRFNKR